MEPDTRYTTTLTGQREPVIVTTATSLPAGKPPRTSTNLADELLLFLWRGLFALCRITTVEPTHFLIAEFAHSAAELTLSLIVEFAHSAAEPTHSAAAGSVVQLAASSRCAA